MSKYPKTTANSLEEFLFLLREYERKTLTKFVCIKSPKTFAQEKYTPSIKTKIHWNGFVPHFCLGNRVYTCHMGKDRNLHNKRHYAEKRDSKDYIVVRRKLKKPTKKLNCPALFYVSRKLSLPSFKVSKITPYEKKKTAQAIRKKIQEGEEIIGEYVYSFRFPDETSHQNHDQLTAAETETINPKVRLKIKELVSQGRCNVSSITALLEQYVVNELGETNKSRIRFYPQWDCITSIVNAVKQERRSKIDLENVELLLLSWEQKDLSGLYFRPCTNLSEICTQQEESEKENQTEWKQTLSNHLLFVYQSEQMKELYHRYGKDGILLDAAYKICDWVLPLYILAVKTNVGHQPVAVFIIQYETQQAIFEALDIIKQWNPDVTPMFGMVDLAVEEILAVESVFPGIKVFISTFHRERAWKRWCSKSNSRTSMQRSEAREKLRAIANAPNEKKLQDNVEEMKKWSHYDESKLKIFFERKWLPEIKRWALAYKPLDFLFHTINGVERINKELKYYDLIENKNCSLSEMMNIIMINYLPNRYKSYVNNNIYMMTPRKKFAENIPKFLLNRPKWIVDFVTEKLDMTCSVGINQLMINKKRENLYEISSLTSKNVLYQVNCNNSTTCTCDTFMQNRFICKHMLLIGESFPEFDISNLILKNEVFRVDENVVNLQNSSSNIPPISMAEDELNDIFCPKQRKHEKLVSRESMKNELISKCNSQIGLLQSFLPLLGEQHLEKVKNELQRLCDEVNLHIASQQETVLATTNLLSMIKKAKQNSKNQ